MKKIFQELDCLSKKDIIGYLNDNLDKIQRQKVEGHLIDCPLCDDAMEGFQSTPKLVEVLAVEDQIKFENLELPRKRVFLLQNLNRIAATILLLVIPAALFLYWNNQKVQLFEKYHSTYDSSIFARSSEGENATLEMDADLKVAFQAYEGKVYAESITKFESYLEKDRENIKAILYLGLSLLEEGETEEAIDKLTTVRINDEKYYEEASWYLALAYTQAKSNKEAIMVLEDLLKVENGFYADKAEKLLVELKKIDL